MRFHVLDVNGGVEDLEACGAYAEISEAVGGISLWEAAGLHSEKEAEGKQLDRMRGKTPINRGVQSILRELLGDRLTLTDRGWAKKVDVFPDPGPSLRRPSGWTLDYRGTYPDGTRVGLVVSFNHGEALPRNLLRLALACTEDVGEQAEIDIGAMIIGTDQLKGKGKDSRMDSSVGTLEQVIPLIDWMGPAMPPAPLSVFGIDWADGGFAGEMEA